MLEPPATTHGFHPPDEEDDGALGTRLLGYSVLSVLAIDSALLSGCSADQDSAGETGQELTSERDAVDDVFNAIRLAYGDAIAAKYGRPLELKWTGPDDHLSGGNNFWAIELEASMRRTLSPSWSATRLATRWVALPFAKSVTCLQTAAG